MRVRIGETEGYRLYVSTDMPEWATGPIGEISEEMYARWISAQEAWKAYQSELDTFYSLWSRREFEARVEKEGAP